MSNDQNVVAAEVPAGYQVRRFEVVDAPGVVACVERIYGNTYVHAELYDVDKIARLNETQALVSVVALDGNGDVVGHYGLERPDLGAIAETGEALVLPEHRHHQLMEVMRQKIEQEAQRLELDGIFGHAVTNHVFTQKVDERFGETPCAVSLGWSPRSFHNMAEPLPQRMSELLYFKYLRSACESLVHLPEHHRDWCLRLYGALGTRLEEGTPRTPSGAGEHVVEFAEALGRAKIRVQRVGEDSSESLAALLRTLTAQGAEAVFLELPLADPGTPDLCHRAEQLGFFFSGLGPRFAGNGDALRLQWLGVPLDISLIQILHEFTQELLNYVETERQRTGKAHQPLNSTPLE